MAQNEPLVTIGIPFHNAADTLLDALRSVFAQTYTNWELILAVDGSTDGSDRIAGSIHDKRVRVIGDDKRRFIAYRLNQITREANGQFIARMDGDDISAPNRIEKQISFLQSHTEVDGCGTGMFATDGNLCLVGRHVVCETHDEICENPMKGIKIAHPTFVGKADWFRKNQYNNHSSDAEDWDLWLRTFRKSSFANINEPLYVYRGVGMFSLKYFVHAKQLIAKMLLRQRQEGEPLWSCILHAARQYRNIAAYILLLLFGKADKFSGRRGKPVTQEEIETFDLIMDKIRATKVPLSK